MADRLGRVERLLVGGPLVLLGVFLCYNVGLRVVLTVGVTTPLANLVGWLFATTPLDTNPVRWTVVVLGTLPLVWVGGRTLRGRSTRRTSWWAVVWAVGVVGHTVGPFRTLLDWGYEYAGFDFLLLVPTRREVTLVSGFLVVVLILGVGLTSLWNWIQNQSDLSTGAATSTEDDSVSTAGDESPPSAVRRSLLLSGWLAGVAVALLFHRDKFPFSPLQYGDDRRITPPASFEFESRSDGRVRITHVGGDTYTEDNAATVTVKYTDATGTRQTETWVGDDGEFSLEAGDTYTTTKPVKPDTILRVIWTAPGGRKTETVGAFKMPA